jgi:hypothetical protein
MGTYSVFCPQCCGCQWCGGSSKTPKTIDITVSGLANKNCPTPPCQHYEWMDAGVVCPCDAANYNATYHLIRSPSNYCSFTCDQYCNISPGMHVGASGACASGATGASWTCKGPGCAFNVWSWLQPTSQPWYIPPFYYLNIQQCQISLGFSNGLSGTDANDYFSCDAYITKDISGHVLDCYADPPDYVDCEHIVGLIADTFPYLSYGPNVDATNFQLQITGATY